MFIYNNQPAKMSSPNQQSEYYKGQKNQADYDKILFAMMDIVDNAQMNDGNYLKMCNHLKTLRQQLKENGTHTEVEHSRRARVNRFTPEKIQQRIRKEIKEKNHECDNCGSLFVSNYTLKNHQLTTKKCSQIICERVYTDATKRVTETEAHRMRDGNRVAKKNILLGAYDRRFIKNLVSIYNQKKHAAIDNTREEMKHYLKLRKLIGKHEYLHLREWSIRHIRKQFRAMREE